MKFYLTAKSFMEIFIFKRGDAITMFKKSNIHQNMQIYSLVFCKAWQKL